MNQGEYDLLVRITAALESIAENSIKIAESLDKKSASKAKAH